MSARIRPSRASLGLLFAALLATTALSYQPAWHGGLLWDDDGHVTRADLQSADGLRRIWFDIGATQQYYPLTHTAFWLMQRAWGDRTTGYHAVNIALHALSAWLLAMILRRLAVPGAILAAVVFALHPVQVESVAWITELKNTLSGALYLGAAWAYLRFDERRDRRAYATASALFLLALLAKTVTATLPAGLLVALWWRHGRIEWNRDVRPLLPWFAIGAAAGLMTAWVERSFIGASGAGFDLTIVERALLAGRAAWFYLGKILWPAELVFIYPRWDVDQRIWWQYLYPGALLVLLAGLWRWRTVSRGLLAAILFFLVTLSPALGFVNVFPFKFSFVADHFQYLAGIGIMTLASAALVTMAQRLSAGRPGIAEVAVAAAIAVPLGMLSRQQSRHYVDAETLYRATLDRNPACWMALHNLGLVELQKGDEPEAADLISQSLAIQPDNAEAHNSLGLILQGQGRADEALRHFLEAARLAPRYAVAHNSLGVSAYAAGRLDDAIAHYGDALRLDPRYSEARRNLGLALLDTGRADEALAELNEAVRLSPDAARMHDSLATALLRLGRIAEATTRYREALRLDPGSAEIRNNLGIALEQQGRLDEALAEFREALRARPGSARLHDNAGFVLFRLNRHAEAESHLREAIRIDPGYGPAHAHLANLLHAGERLPEAVAQYRRALTFPVNRTAAMHNDLGVALAGLGRLNEAIREFQEALRISPDFEDARGNLRRARRR
jgi:tetratricopeptide (TPR) repeat protein